MAVPSPPGADSPLACAVKNDLRSGIYSYRSKRTGVELPFLCCGGHIRKQMYVFSRLRLRISKGRRKNVSSVSVKWILVNRSKQQEVAIRRPDTAWLFRWKEVNRNLKECIFVYVSAFFVVVLKKQSNGRKHPVFVKNWLARLPTVYCAYFYLSGRLGMLRFREF